MPDDDGEDDEYVDPAERKFRFLNDGKEENPDDSDDSVDAKVK